MLEEYADFLEQGRYFANALEQFELILKTLVDEKTLGWEHGDIERWLSTAGNELLRRFLQGHFDQRTETESVHESVEGSDGIVRTHRRQQVRRKLTTQFGDIDHHRIGYSQAGAMSLFPMGLSLNLGATKYSDGLCHRVAEKASKSSFDECVKAIDSTTGGRVPKRQCEELVSYTQSV